MRSVGFVSLIVLLLVSCVSSSPPPLTPSPRPLSPAASSPAPSQGQQSGIPSQNAAAVLAQQKEDVFKYCQRVVTDDDPGAVPASLIPSFVRAFGSFPNAGSLEGFLHYRCYQGSVMGCVVGANLNCGKANISVASQGGDEWCREHPNDQIIPMVATGHSTIYSWRCSGTRAVADRKISPVDDRGFEVSNWKVLN